MSFKGYRLVFHLLFCLELSVNFSLLAQDKRKVDSLTQVLENKLSDTTRINTLNQLGDIYSVLDSSKTAKYVGEALSMAYEIEYKKGIVDALGNKAYSLMVGGNYQESLSVFKEAYLISKKSSYLGGQAQLLNDMGVNFHYIGEIDSTLSYFKRSFAIKEIMGDDLDMAKSLSNIGAIFQYTGKYDSAVHYFQKALITMEEKGSSRDRAIVVSNIGNIEYDKGNLNKALKSFEATLTLFQEAGDIPQEARITVNVAVVLSDLGNYAKALQYQYRALDLYAKIQDEQGASNCYHEMSNISIRQEEYEAAMNHILRAIEIRKRINYLKGLSESYINASDIAKELGEIDQALDYVSKAINILYKIQDPRNLAASHTNLGLINLEKGNLIAAKESLDLSDSILSILGDKVLISQLQNAFAKFYLAQGKDTQAITAAEMAKSFAQTAKFPTSLRVAANLLADSYAQQGNYKKAYENQVLFKRMDDSLLNLENTKRLARLETQYEFDKKEEQLRIEQAKKELDLKQTNDRNLLVASIGVGILMLIVLFVFLQNRQRNKYAKVVEQKNEQLSETMASKEKLFSVIAHDLKSPLSAFSSISSTLAENIDAFQKDQIVTYLKKFEKSSQNLSELLNNLLQWSLSQTGSLSVKPEELDIQQLTEEAIRPLTDLADSKGVKLSIESEPLRVTADHKMVETVIRNLVSNALKFTDRGGEVQVKANRSDDFLKIRVIDSGIGMSPEEANRLFDMRQDVSKVGDHEEKGTGIGLILCKELVEKNNGRIWVESQKGIGSTFSISLPIAA